MKYSFAAGAALAGLASAFPTINLDAASKAAASSSVKRQAFGVNVQFDPAQQYVSNKGKYAFVAPGPTDLRGPCPGLNAMANHGYIPHNGIATIEQFIDGTEATFGMARDLGGFLAIYGAIFDGDLLSWSIGGPPPKSLVSDLGNLLGQPEGISGSHNKYESDVSPTRGDLYQYGNDYEVVMQQFKNLYAYQADNTEENSNYDLGVLTSYRGVRFNESIHENPYFFNGPFSGVLVQPAAYTFIYRFMANKSEAFPEGRLSQNVLKSFFSITGDTPDNFVYTPGYEAIPDNWYKRNVADEYSIPFFMLDVLSAAETYPEFLDIGGNTGKVNTFTGLDINNITGGVYNLNTLTEGDNLQCFVFELLIQAGPDVLENIFVDTTQAKSMLSAAIGNATAGATCPELAAPVQSQYSSAVSQFPGATELKSDGTYSSGASTDNGLLGIL